MCMNNKLDELIATVKACDLGKKKEIIVEEKKSCNPIVCVLAVIGAVAAVAAIAYAVYRFFEPDYLDDYDYDDDDDDLEDDFFEDESDAGVEE